MSPEESTQCQKHLVELFPGVKDNWTGEVGRIWERVFSRWAGHQVWEAIDRHRMESKYQTCQPVDIETQCRKIVGPTPTQRASVSTAEHYRRQMQLGQCSDVQAILRWHHWIHCRRDKVCGREYCDRWAAADVQNCAFDLIRMELAKPENDDNYLNVKAWADKQAAVVTSDAMEFEQVIGGLQ